MRLLMLGLLFLTSGLAAAQPVHDTGRTGPRAREGTAETVGQYEHPRGQIHEAIEASHLLIDQLNGLAASGKLTEILILSGSAESTTPKPGPFGAWTTGTSMVFTQTLLSQLTKNREFDVVDQDDILPNNTTFVLANLAFHLSAGEIPAKSYDAAHLDDFVAAMLEQNDSNAKAIAAALKQSSVADIQ